jgi:hypothetical protein
MATWKSVGTSSVKLGSKHVTMHVARRGHDAKATFPPTGISLTVDPRKKTLLDIHEGRASKKEVHDALVIVNKMVGGESVRARPMRANPTKKRRTKKSTRKTTGRKSAGRATTKTKRRARR